MKRQVITWKNICKKYLIMGLFLTVSKISNNSIKKDNPMWEGKKQTSQDTIHGSSVSTRKMVSITMRYYYIPTRMAEVKNAVNVKYWWECEATGTLISYWWECKVAKPFWKMIWQYLTKLNIHLIHDLAMLLLCIYLREIKAYIHTKLWKWILSHILNWEQFNCSSVEEWQTHWYSSWT